MDSKNEPNGPTEILVGLLLAMLVFAATSWIVSDHPEPERHDVGEIDCAMYPVAVGECSRPAHVRTW